MTAEDHFVLVLKMPRRERNREQGQSYQKPGECSRSLSNEHHLS